MPRRLGIAQVSDYDRFVAFCASEFDRRPGDPALRYFDNRFFNRRADNQTGHLRQAFYAAREFYRRHPRLRRIPPALMDEEGRMRMTDWLGIEQWRRFVSQRKNIPLPDGASMETIYKILPASLGGLVAGGGGASPSFKVVLPLVTKYLGFLAD